MSIVVHLNFSPQQFVALLWPLNVKKLRDCPLYQHHHCSVHAVPYEEFIWTRQKSFCCGSTKLHTHIVATTPKQTFFPPVMKIARNGSSFMFDDYMRTWCATTKWMSLSTHETRGIDTQRGFYMRTSVSVTMWRWCENFEFPNSLTVLFNMFRLIKNNSRGYNLILSAFLRFVVIHSLSVDLSSFSVKRLHIVALWFCDFISHHIFFSWPEEEMNCESDKVRVFVPVCWRWAWKFLVVFLVILQVQLVHARSIT